MKTIYNSKYITFKMFREEKRCLIKLHNLPSYKIEKIVSELTNNSLYTNVRLSNYINKNYKLIDLNTMF